MKIAFTNIFALGLGVSEANPILQTVSLILAIGYTAIGGSINANGGTYIYMAFA